jgi:hypothetical protein
VARWHIELERDRRFGIRDAKREGERCVGHRKRARQALGGTKGARLRWVAAMGELGSDGRSSGDAELGGDRESSAVTVAAVRAATGSSAPKRRSSAATRGARRWWGPRRGSSAAGSDGATVTTSGEPEHGIHSFTPQSRTITLRVGLFGWNPILTGSLHQPCKTNVGEFLGFPVLVRKIQMCWYNQPAGLRRSQHAALFTWNRGHHYGKANTTSRHWI